MPSPEALVSRVSNVVDAVTRALGTEGYSTLAGESVPKLWSIDRVDRDATSFQAVLVIDEEVKGEIRVIFRRESAGGSPGDVCAEESIARATRHIPRYSVTTCEAVPMRGERIQVLTGTVDGGSVMAATRFVQGGLLTVMAVQGTLPAPPLTAEGLAELATNSRLLP
jgi:hypothetical protein